MNIYLKNLVLALALCGMPLNIYADTQNAAEINAAEPVAAVFNIPKIETIRIDSKQQHFDRVATRYQYLKWGCIGALSAYVVYKNFIQSDTIAPEAKKLAELTQQVNSLAEQVEKLGKPANESLLSRIGSTVSNISFGLGLSTFIQIVAYSIASNKLSRLVDVDSFWETMRSEPDLVKGIIAKSKRLVPDMSKAPLTSLETDHLCRMIQDSGVLLKKNIEALIGFIRHKQSQDKDLDPIIVAQINDQILYLTMTFNHFAEKMTTLLNTDYSSMDKKSAAIIECAQQFGDDYGVIRDQFKVLAD